MTPPPAGEPIPGNFLIMIRGDEIIVQSNAKSQPAQWLMGLAFLAFSLFEMSHLVPVMIRDLQQHSSMFGYLFLPLIVAAIGSVILQLARLAGGGQQILRCTRSSLELSRLDFGRTWGVQDFPLSEIERVQFAAVAYSQDGNGMGLRFTIGGKGVKTLRGLTAVGAQRVLTELQRLGVSVNWDPGMKMMVEMEQSRGKSWFGRMIQ